MYRFFVMVKIQNKSYLVTLASCYFCSTWGINGTGKPASFADASKSVNDMQSVNEKTQYDAESLL